MAELIKQVVSEAIVTELADPRVTLVTVTGVDVSPDMRTADVRISVIGDEAQQQVCLKGVRHAHGYLQDRVSDAVTMKFCPVLKFHLDESVKRSVSVSALIAQARAEDEAARADRIRRGVEEAEDGGEDDEAPDAGGGEPAP